MFNSVVSFDSALPQEQGECRLFRFSLTASQAFNDAGCFDSTALQALRFLYSLG